MLQLINNELRKVKNLVYAQQTKKYFKTDPGEYAAHDKFIGITMPVLRKMAQKYQNISFRDQLALLQSDIHEKRMLALLIQILIFKKYTNKQDLVYSRYVKYVKYVNNWDLVDISAPNIMGAYLHDKEPGLLFFFAKGNNLWKKRIAIVSQLYSVRKEKIDVALQLAHILKNDTHDLIHKAVGWVLREIGKIDMKAEENFLNKTYKILPRTLLRYAIERFPKTKKNYYMQK